MILSDSNILSRLAEGDLVVDPIDDVNIQAQLASVDLRFSIEFLEFQCTNISCIHPNHESEVPEYVRGTHVPKGDDFILHPGDSALGTTKERVEIPTDLLVIVKGRSSFGCLVVVTYATVGIVDPGYEGQITFELSNLGTAPVVLIPGVYTSQLVLTKMKLSTDCPYGVERGSKYQGQRGPQMSRPSSDPEFSSDE